MTNVIFSIKPVFNFMVNLFVRTEKTGNSFYLFNFNQSRCRVPVFSSREDWRKNREGLKLKDVENRKCASRCQIASSLCEPSLPSVSCDTTLSLHFRTCFLSLCVGHFVRRLLFMQWYGGPQVSCQHFSLSLTKHFSCNKI